MPLLQPVAVPSFTSSNLVGTVSPLKASAVADGVVQWLGTCSLSCLATGLTGAVGVCNGVLVIPVPIAKGVIVSGLLSRNCKGSGVLDLASGVSKLVFSQPFVFSGTSFGVGVGVGSVVSFMSVSGALGLESFISSAYVARGLLPSTEEVGGLALGIFNAFTSLTPTVLSTGGIVGSTTTPPVPITAIPFICRIQ